jgi:endonuclease YncB( thermonuclease family)
MRAIDGDTIEARIDNHRVATGLLGIEAPMGNTTCGRRSRAALQALLRNGAVFEEDNEIAFDERGRRMYYAYTPDARSIARALVRQGLARPTGQGIERDALAVDWAEAAAEGVGCATTIPH